MLAYPPVAAIMYRHDGSAPGDIVGRGTKCDVWGVECTYLGPDDTGAIWFVRGPGEAAWLTERLLYNAGYFIVDYRVVYIGALKAQFEATRERNTV